MNIPISKIDRAAYTPSEFAALFGREKTWTYRKFYAGKLKMIQGLGERLVPASEVDRLTAQATSISGDE